MYYICISTSFIIVFIFSRSGVVEMKLWGRLLLAVAVLVTVTLPFPVGRSGDDYEYSDVYEDWLGQLFAYV